jgi:hypothetical protein
MQVGGKMLYYHYARMNFCYRWCLEDAVEYGWKVDYLKYMVRTSLISGELDLAQKYINTLKKTLFYRGWAEKYEKMVRNPQLIAKDREMASILPLYQYEDQLDGDNSLVEIYLLNYFAHTYSEFTTPLFDEAALMCALTLKDIPTFWKTEADTQKEDAVFDNWVQTLPEETKREFSALLAEMNGLETLESRIYKALDKMEAVIQHNESDISTWLPLEYDLQLRYGGENVKFSPWFQSLKAEVDNWTLRKIAESQ